MTEKKVQGETGEQTLTAPALACTQTHETTEEFTLPDYMPAIRRILRVSATPLPESRFLTGSALEFSGTVSYSVLYIGEAGELYCAPLTSEYTASTACPEGTVADAAGVYVDTWVEAATCRVTEPRRLTLRSRLKTKLTAVSSVCPEDRLCTPEGDRVPAALADTAERLIATATGVSLARGETTAVAGGALSTAGKVICPRGAVKILTATAGDGAVTLSGEVLVFVLLRTEEGQYACVKEKAPFTEVVTVPGALPGDIARGYGRVAAITVTPGQTGATWEAEFDLEAEAARRTECPYTADLFSTAGETALTMRETENLRLLRCATGALTVNGEGGHLPAGATVLDCEVVCTPDRVEARDGRLQLGGNCAATVLLLNDGEITSEEFSFPFKYTPDGEADAGELLYRCTADVIGVTCRPAGEKLSVTAELSLSMTVLCKERVRYVSEATLAPGKGAEKTPGSIRICYPGEGESLWDIAKRYGVSRDAIRAENGLAGDVTVSDGAPILI